MDIIIQYIKDNPTLIIANIIAFIAVAVTFISYQANSQKKLLVIQIIATAETIKPITDDLITSLSLVKSITTIFTAI